MKWLSGGLTFVNFATVCGLLLGIVAGGLSKGTAILSICLGLAVAVLAFITTRDQERFATSAKKGANASPRTYKSIWLWLVGACFAMFAVRSFCWLLYIDSDQLRIQSPNNLGDLALHITYIRNFASGVALWPENPIYLLSSVRYPAGIDLFNGLLLLIGVNLRHGLIWVGLLASLATFYAFKRWAGTFGVAAFLFNGGIVGFQLLSTGKWLDYQGDASIAWKSIPLAMFVTQRGLLYAIPAGVLLLYQWRAKYFSAVGGADPGKAAVSRENVRGGYNAPLPFWVECSLYATMPLFHLHTFIALSLMLGFWFVLTNATVRKQLLLLVGCAALPATFLVWLITDHFQASSVLSWKIGWVQPEASGNEFARPFFEFWFVNFGLTLLLAFLLLGLWTWGFWKSGPKFPFRVPTTLAFLIPAAAIFALACSVKFAPWEWDNTKLMIWSYFMILPFLWKDLIAPWPKEVRIGVCIVLFGSGLVSLFGGLAAGGYGFASRSELDGVAVALKKLPVAARFAAFPTYNHPLLLNGRKVVAGYPGHLWTQGFDYSKVNDQLNALMTGAPDWQQIARRLKARYLFWGREERTNYSTSTRPWEQTLRPVATGTWGEIYDLEPTQSSDNGPRTN
jgi:hypothetical protein